MVYKRVSSLIFYFIKIILYKYIMDYKRKYYKYKCKYLQNKYKQNGGNIDEDEIIKQINKMSDEEIRTMKSISFDDLCGLYLRVYERDDKNKSVEPIQFTPPKVHKFVQELNDWSYDVYVEKKFKNIRETPMKDLFFDFKTDKNKIKLIFSDNYSKGSKIFMEVNLPIKFTDLVDKIFEHFDDVGLPGYPDNGGIDCITYDSSIDAYKIGTWS